jgi:DNA-binding response OmpR family regulator
MPSAKRILLVDDDIVLRTSLAEQLAREGAYHIVEAASLAEASEATAQEPYEFIILDSDLPDGKGETLAVQLRARGIACPILLLSDVQDGTPPSDASDRIAKPFRFAALMARLHALLGSHAGSENELCRIGPYIFHPSAKTLTAGPRKIRLTEKETNILKFLHLSGGTVPRETLLHEVWGYNPTVTTHTLETHIYRLRRKIEEGDRLLVTEEGGYRLLS